MKIQSDPEFQSIQDNLLLSQDVEMDVLREDAIDPIISGNKLRKLTYNIEAYNNGSYHQLVTFGGAFSNHLAATAEAGKRYGIPTVGIVRGEKVSPLNATLMAAIENGMELRFVDRQQYREGRPAFWKTQFPNLLTRPYFLPEGGSNSLAVKGCAEILGESTAAYDVICCPVGTGGTLAGLIHGALANQHVIGFAAIKGGEGLRIEIDRLLLEYDNVRGVAKKQYHYSIETAYHCGGYAKINEELIKFTNRFYAEHGIPLDLIYTAKMMLGVWKEIALGKMKGKRVLVIHTGGLQGNSGMIKRYGLTPWY